MILVCLQDQQEAPISFLLVLLVCLMPSCLHDLYIYSYPSALLICTENTFWDINRNGKFVERFKKSFTLYVESGMREMTERDIDTLRKECGGFSSWTKDFNAEFYKFIVDHYLRKFHCFYLNSNTSNHCHCLQPTLKYLSWNEKMKKSLHC